MHPVSRCSCLAALVIQACTHTPALTPAHQPETQTRETSAPSGEASTAVASAAAESAAPTPVDALAVCRHFEQESSLTPAEREYNLAILDPRCDHHADAVRRFEAALALQPDDHAARLELARMYAEGWGVARDVRRAREMLRAVAREDAGELGASAALSVVMLSIEDRTNDVPASELQAYLERAIAAGHTELEVLRGLITDRASWSSPPAWTAFAPGSQRRVLRRFGGAWNMRHTVPGIVSDSPEGEPIWEDIETSSCVSVLPDGDTAEVEINTASMNDHYCLVEGRGGVNRDGDLVVQTDTPLMDYAPREPVTGPLGWIRFSFERGVLRLAEVWPTECAWNPDWCGARGEMLGHEFPVSERQRDHRCEDFDEIRGR